ncbi:MAG: LON peptidase substrate-binding domain-containing protein [Acidimicrobiia bacterium]|nr:LON peptidase substrate-binding domain-containing protein [Acidimicrobiia bacterium]
MPMFPLGSTVFPGQVVPLHVFEPRYRALLDELLGGDSEPTFGIVLIDRGFEVGGGDHRVDVATRVEILQAEEFEDGRWAVVTAGVERLDILEWLSDDPYPRAIVAPRPVDDDGGASLDDLQDLLLATIELAARSVGVDPPESLDFSNDPQTRLDQLSALSPLTEFDRQKVLEARTTSRQIALLSEALSEKQLLIRAELDGR